MKNLKYILLSLVSVFFIAACSDDKENPVYDASQATAPTLKAISSTYAPVLADADNTFADFTYSAANWGMDLGTQYTLQASLTKDFTTAYDLGSSTSTTISVINSKINSILINNGIAAGTTTPIYFRVLAKATGLSGTLSSITPLTSAVINTNYTPYSTEIQYPKVYILGDFCGWSHDNAQHLWSYGNNTTYTGVINFGAKAANGWKITGAANWDNATGNWGTGSAAPASEAATINLANNGGNISCYSKTFYGFKLEVPSVDAPVLTQLFAFNVLSIVGAAGSQVSGWGTKEVDFNFDAAKQRFYADVTLDAGVIKFRADHGWSVNWGGKDGILSAGGDNIAVTAGNYRVYVDLNNPSKLTYELNAKDYGK